MAIVQLKSSNPAFSFIIRKNPATGMSIREIRKGYGHGWFSDESTYNVYFKDADNDVSYKLHKNEEFEYLNTTRYNSPMAILNLLNEYFDSPLKKKVPEDTGEFTNELVIPLLNIENARYIRAFQDNFPAFALEAYERAHKSYSITVRTQASVHELVNYVSLFCLFLAIFSGEYLDIGDSLIVRYLSVINALDAPFYIRHLFARNVLNSRALFKRYRSELETTSRYDIKLQYGGTALQRRDAIRELLSFDKSILDVGCGEGFYAIPFAQNIPDCLYYAVDVDEAMVTLVSQRAQKAEVDNVITYASFDSFLESYSEESVDVILTEVIEHMEQTESAKLLSSIIQNVDFDKLIVTTPNAAFNPFYLLDGFRHEDHKWEMNTDEFQAWVKDVCGTACALDFIGMGDAVDGIHTTQGVVIRKRSRNP